MGMYNDVSAIDWGGESSILPVHSSNLVPTSPNLVALRGGMPGGGGNNILQGALSSLLGLAGGGGGGNNIQGVISSLLGLVGGGGGFGGVGGAPTFGTGGYYPRGTMSNEFPGGAPSGGGVQSVGRGDYGGMLDSLLNTVQPIGNTQPIQSTQQNPLNNILALSRGNPQMATGVFGTGGAGNLINRFQSMFTPFQAGNVNSGVLGALRGFGGRTR